MLLSAIQLLLFLAIPGLLIYGKERIKLIEWLSPAFFCYVAGILMAIVPGFPISPDLAGPITSGTVVLAIPLMLFSTHMKSWLKLAPGMVLSFALWSLAVCISASAAILLYFDILPEAWNLGGMSTGVYIGGTANMAAIHLARGVEETLFLEMNLTDMILSSIYLVFLLTFAQKLFQLVYPTYQPVGNQVEAPPEHEDSADEKVNLRLWPIAQGILASIIVLGIAVGLSWLFKGEISDVWVIVLITIGGLLSSLINRVRLIPLTYETGEYLFLVFCMVIGAQVDVATFLANSHPVMGLMACTLYGAVLIHLIFAKLFRLDADTIAITSAAGIFGPPFVAPVAHSLNNREIVASGMTIGVLGLAVGNFLGLLMSWLWAP